MKDPTLIDKIGTTCGKCVLDVGEIDSTGYESVIENRQGLSRNEKQNT